MKTSYDDVNNLILNEIEKHRGADRLVLFGADLTGQLVYDAVKNHPHLEVDCFLDSKPFRKTLFPPVLEGLNVFTPHQAELDEETQTVVLCAHPRWYFDMIPLIRKRFKQITIIELLKNEELREKIMDINRTVNRRDDQYREIKLVIESQPRSGTTWLATALVNNGKGNFASTFKYDYTHLQHKVYYDIHYRNLPGELVVLSHFHKPVSHHAASRYPIVYPLRYLFDGYYSWCRLHDIYRQDGGGPYFLSARSREWKLIKKHIPLNKVWLEMIKDRLFLRYEDWLLNPLVNIDKLKTVIPEIEPGWFDVRAQKDRLYFTGDYRSKMDEDVFNCLKENFKELINHYWPEKGEDIF